MADTLRLDRIRNAHGARVVLRDISLALPAGDSVALVGASGIGKTTLLRVCAGLDLPDAGEVWIRDQLATKDGSIIIPPYRRDIGFVFQDLALWPHMTVAQSLAFVIQSDT